MDKKYDLEERLLDFSSRIVQFAEALPDSRAGRHVAGQILRSGTSPMAHHGEAQAAESRNDFVHKMKIALKELRETIRWIKLSQRIPLVENPKLLEGLKQENEELIRIFVTSIATAESNRPSGKP